MARAGAEGAHTTCTALGPSAGRAGRGRLGWEWRLRRRECMLRRTWCRAALWQGVMVALVRGGCVRWCRGRMGREVRGDALNGVADVGGRVCEDVQ